MLCCWFVTVTILHTHGFGGGHAPALLLTTAADALRERHPLAATLLWRAVIDFALVEDRASRYRHAASHLNDCDTVAPEIDTFDAFPSHDQYVDELRVRHKRKSSFWAKFDAQ